MDNITQAKLSKIKDLTIVCQWTHSSSHISKIDRPMKVSRSYIVAYTSSIRLSEIEVNGQHWFVSCDSESKIVISETIPKTWLMKLVQYPVKTALLVPQQSKLTYDQLLKCTVEYELIEHQVSILKYYYRGHSTISSADLLKSSKRAKLKCLTYQDAVVYLEHTGTQVLLHDDWPKTWTIKLLSKSLVEHDPWKTHSYYR